MLDSTYTGRFAPSPSGPLHMGSLLSALASYLDAKKRMGRWLVRMEDIDPPRELPGADIMILETLRNHGLHWDGGVVYQSRREKHYKAVLNHLVSQRYAYACDCTRQRLQSLKYKYDGHCRDRSDCTKPFALRIRVDHLPSITKDTVTANIQFIDGIQGYQSDNLETSGDFVIHRKDGLFAYQLAVVVDDIHQNISHIIRGYDLLETTSRQIFLYTILGKPSPSYSHIPVLTDPNGTKLSKQNKAPALDPSSPKTNIRVALKYLGVDIPDSYDNLSSILSEAILRWSPVNLQGKTTIIQNTNDAHF